MRGLSPAPAGLTDRRAAMERVSSGTRASVLVLVLAVAMLVAACGSESSAPAEEQQSGTSSVQEEPASAAQDDPAPAQERALTHEEYVAAADAICADAEAEIDALGEPESLDQLAEFFEQEVAIQENQIEQLRSLQAPAEDAAKATRVYDLLEETVEIVKGAQGSIDDGDIAAVETITVELAPIQAEADKIADELGLEACGTGNGEQSADSSEEGDAAANPMPIEELTAASCTPFPGVPPTAWDHLEDIPADYTFGTFPRTADIHSPDLLIWNFYPAPVDQMWLGHNLEHGGIYVQYGDDVPADTVEQIGAWWMDDPNGIIVAPLPELDGDVIALGAWYAPVQSSNGDLVYSTSTGELAYCTAFDEVAFTAFRDAFRGMGPERLPIESLTPGR